MVLRHASVLAVAAIGWLLPNAAAASATLTGAAGIGGTAKPGRWTPVSVTVHAQDEDLSGLLLVTWGDASSQRPVSIQQGARKGFEFYLRTMEPAAAINVRLLPADACDADGTCAQGTQALASIDLPVRTIPAADPLTLCLGAVSPADAGSACTASTTPEALPQSFRGFDAVDEVIFSVPGDASLPDGQGAALTRWRAVRALDAHGDLAATDRPPSIMAALERKNRTPAAARFLMAAYAVLLLGAILAVRRRETWVAATAFVAVVLLGTASALAAGQFGPGSTIVIHHATLVQQLPGGSGALVTLRGAAEYPAFDRYELQAAIGDGSIDAGPRLAQDDNGHPVLIARHGAGARQAFTLEAAVDANLLTVTREGQAVRVGNTSGGELQDCRVTTDGATDVIERLAPGAAIVADVRGEPVGPIVTCLMEAPPIPFADSHRHVTTQGRTIVVAYLDPAEGPVR